MRVLTPRRALQLAVVCAAGGAFYVDPALAGLGSAKPPTQMELWAGPKVARLVAGEGGAGVRVQGALGGQWGLRAGGAGDDIVPAAPAPAGASQPGGASGAPAAHRAGTEGTGAGQQPHADPPVNPPAAPAPEAPPDAPAPASPPSPPPRDIAGAASSAAARFCAADFPLAHAAHLNGSYPDSFSMAITDVRFSHPSLAQSSAAAQQAPFTMHIYNIGLSAPAPPPGDDEPVEADEAEQGGVLMDRRSAAVLNSAIRVRRRGGDGAGGYLESATAAQLLLGLERKFKELAKVEKEATREDVVFVDVGAGMGWFSLVALSRGFSVLAVEPLDSNLRLLRSSLCANAALGFPARAVAVPLAASDPGVSGRNCTVRSKDTNHGGAVVCRAPSSPSGGGGLADREESAAQRQLASVAGYRARGTAGLATLDEIADSYLSHESGRSPRLRSGRKTIGVVRISARGEEPFAVAGAPRLLRLDSSGPAPLVALSYNPRKLGGEMPARAVLSRLAGAGYAVRTDGFAPSAGGKGGSKAGVEDLVRRHRATVKVVYFEKP